MAATEDRLVVAMRAKTAERRGQRQRMVWIAGAAASYAIDAVFLVLFMLAGTLPASVPAAYGLGAAAVCVFFYGVTATNRNLTLREPGMVLAQNVCGIALQFVVLFMAPQIAFPWLANLMTVLAFSMVWLSFRASTAVWALCTALTGIFFHGYADRIGVPLSSAPEIALDWAYFSLVLGRCVFLSVYSTSMRRRLQESRRKLAASMEQIQELVSYDELTKTFNRRAMMARLEQERSGAQRTGAPFSVAMLDLDHFKRVNDTCGHAAGDAVLKGFVRIVHATMRDTDVLCRYGGEEFLMLLTDTTPAAAAIPLERVRATVAAHDWSAVAPEIALTVSAGVAGWRKGESLEALLGRADAALYKAKRNGRDRVEAG